MKRLLCVLLVAGCSAVHWEKPGATPESVDADLRNCASTAQTMPALPEARTTTGEVRPGHPASGMDISADQRLQQGQRQEACMRAKGYSLKPG